MWHEVAFPYLQTMHDFLRQCRSSTFRKGPNEFRYKFSFKRSLIVSWLQHI